MDSSKNLWLGSINGFLKVNGDKTQWFEHIENNPKSLARNKVRLVYVDSYNNKWVSSTGGLQRIYPEPESFELFQVPTIETSLSYRYVYSICEEKPVLLWLAQDGGGLVRLSFKQEKNGTISNVNYLLYNYKKEDTTSLPGNNLNSVVRDQQGFLWVSSYSNGLAKLDPRTHVFKRYNTNSGLESNVINTLFVASDSSIVAGTSNGIAIINKKGELENFKISEVKSIAIMAIQEDSQKRLWISSTSGLFLFERESERFYSFNSDADLKISSFFEKSTLQKDDGEILFGGNNGYISFYPDSIEINTKNPIFKIT